VAKREWRNWIRLFERGLPTITPVAMGIAKNYAYLVSVAHDDYSEACTRFDTLGYKERLRLLEGLGVLFQNMHRAGFCHGKLHRGNFLLRFDGRGLDLKIADFQKGGFKRITYDRRLKDLADLALAHFFHLGVKEQFAFLTGYLGGRQEARAFIRHEGKRLERLILKRASLVVDRMVRKSCKVSTYSDRLTLQGGRYKGVYVRKNRDLIPKFFLASPLDFMYKKEVGLLKDYNSVRVITYQDICIKYYMRRGAKDLLKSWFGLSKGKKSFRWALALVQRFIPTPEPICYLEGRDGNSFYLSRFVHSTRNLMVHLGEVSQEKQKECLKALTLFLNRMFYRGVYHMDLKGTNILVRKVGRGFRFYLTDTDEMAISWKGIHRPLHKSLLRITRTLVPYFSRDELVEFAVGCISSSPVTMSPQDVVDQAFKIEAPCSKLQGIFDRRER
jgi:tRNA A-37 threonylcarbamoyl transferase component Bud32